MEQWPNWFLDALKLRFDASALTAQKQYALFPVHQKLAALNDAIRQQADDGLLVLLSEWEDTLNHKHNIEKEWLYMQGVQDGIRIIYPALHSSDYRSIR
ncbi:hypothetical protein SAMN04487970_10613 [Paenibacillus tianmuensis]|uniref:Uncharacterized protein n=1 Tax=Paenibacillus tianmuensis TaxID=624147 RepID=A0A1G4TPM4_9BACL|nr:hypothetical protein [Paenibacillus tianmuensis]SCW83298.1 hypothetical protein SAMN04487970_10613 [Paenibacillus tianmuensis]